MACSILHFTFCILTCDFLVLIAGCKARRPAMPTPQMDTKAQFQVRVLLFNDITSCTFKAISSYNIDEGDDSRNFEFSISDLESSGEPLTTQSYLGQLDVPTNVQLVDGKITIAGQSFTSNQITIVPDNPYIFNLNGDTYRGRLKLILSADCNSFDAVNIIPMEPYLAGVVGAEMPRYWEPEALKAQTIAARTYCLYTKKRFGSNRAWDVTKTQANQVYPGVIAESAQVWEAVNQTRGQVLVCRQPDGSEDIFPAYYSSTCGGHTENSCNVFGDRFEPLAGVSCPYCRNVAKPTFFFWPIVLFNNADVTAKLTQRYPALTLLGEITDINSVKQSDYENFSRITEVKLLGSTGKSGFLKAEDLRLTIDPTGSKIKSTICRIIKLDDKWAFISGRGCGHGVGMCQCGAQGMAREGNTAEQILFYYYPGSKILTIEY